ncbi:MAG TPA: hypothetical protein VIM17_03785 [Jatrophihabitantaceae bacterium]|jgi:hypothetical protein
MLGTAVAVEEVEEVVVVADAVVVSAAVDVPVVSEVVEVVVELEPVSAVSGENGSPSASAPDAITPSTSMATSPAASVSPDLLDLLVRPSTVFLPSLPLLPLLPVRSVPAIA